jgi:hypothetical protein
MVDVPIGRGLTPAQEKKNFQNPYKAVYLVVIIQSGLCSRRMQLCTMFCSYMSFLMKLTLSHCSGENTPSKLATATQPQIP